METLINLFKLKYFIGEGSARAWKLFFVIVGCMVVQVLASLYMDYQVYQIENVNNEISVLENEFSQTRYRLQKMRMESSILNSDKEMKQSEEPPKKIIVKIDD